MTPLNNFKKHLICWGSRDQATVINEIIEELGAEIDLFVTDDYSDTCPIKNSDLCYGMAGLQKWLQGKNKAKVGFVVAVANPFGHIRCTIHEKLVALGLSSVSIKASSAIIAASAEVAEGLQIHHGVIVNPHAKISKQCILNTRALVEHHCDLEQGVELGPGATLAGRVKISKYSWIGTAAAVLPRINIHTNTIVGAGAVVTKDLGKNLVVTGVPAKIYKKNNIKVEDE
jgi:sugar O-acyltransferase (sialic acid O-acetyltransferase NeuD family)